jgi:hypothetical protein
MPRGKKLRPASRGSLAKRLPDGLPGPAEEPPFVAGESGMAGAGACREDEGWSEEREVEDVNSGLVQ